MLHVEANALRLQPSPSSRPASFCSPSSLEPQDHRRWPATVQGEAPLLVWGCSLWVAPATCQHSGARSKAINSAGRSWILQTSVLGKVVQPWASGGQSCHCVQRKHSLRHTGKGSRPSIHSVGLLGSLSWSPEDGSRS